MVYTGNTDQLYEILAKEGFRYIDLYIDDVGYYPNKVIVLLNCGLTLSLELIQSKSGHYFNSNVILFKNSEKDFGEDLIIKKANITTYPSEREDLKNKLISQAKVAINKYVIDNHYDRFRKILEEWAK